MTSMLIKAGADLDYPEPNVRIEFQLFCCLQ
jgi:hypothetical protein